AQALRGLPAGSPHWPAWTAPLSRAARALASGDPASAWAEAQIVLSADLELPLPTVFAVRAALASGERPAAAGLARGGHGRWPATVAFRLILAQELIASGDVSRGVDLLHQAAADDPAARVAARYLGADHPYAGLWPGTMRAALSRPIPNEVSAALGENRLQPGPRRGEAPAVEARTLVAPLSAGEAPRSEARKGASPLQVPSVPRPTITDDDLPAPEPWEAFRGPDPGEVGETFVGPAEPETLVDMRRELGKLSSRLRAADSRGPEDGRIPAYIVVSSRTRLIQEFGEGKFRRLDEAVIDLVESIRRRPGWTAYRLYVDDPETLDPFDLAPVDPSNAWQIKLRLGDLDQGLGRRGEMIGALLIVGGQRIVPFHQLPNPTDDDDEEVASDNPYASRDENYFASEWPVGRLASDTDADLLVELIRRAGAEHAQAAAPLAPWDRLRLWLAMRLARYLGRRPRAIGYSASIWRKASLAVFRAIGDPNGLLTSPPVAADSLPTIAFRPARFSYYNLHGLADSPEWFGQRDPMAEEAGSEEYPVALRPQDIVDGGRAPRVVFTEACYGAHTLGKSAEAAMSLKFLESGSQAVVGSTRIAYGSVTPPLIGADLLGRLFWEHLNQNLPAGEALRRAKLALAAEMHRRQGFLDGEDQKTLISFVLYGDPLYSPRGVPAPLSEKIAVRKSAQPSAMKTACALGGPKLAGEDLDPATYDRVKSIVAQYLPGMGDASYRVHAQHCGCDGEDHTCPTHQLGSKALHGPETMVVTLAKEIMSPSKGAGPLRHARFARLTLDSSGRVMKLAVSR
ncbi:MAG: C25 family cysteine peptidase, partial [Anaerolineales bacterium]